MTPDFYVDSHCHLDLFKDIQNNVFLEDMQPIKTITVTNAPSFFKPNADLFRAAKNIRVGIGLHPELASQFGDQIAGFRESLFLSKYVGEIGLDGSTRFVESFASQERIFEAILVAVSETEGKILSIHSRNASKQTVALLEKYLPANHNRAILHWYTGDKESMKKAVDIGCFFSFNHKMMQTPKGVEILKFLPLDRILTETDAPFTFDNIFKTRLKSLKFSVDAIATTLNRSSGEVRALIFENFRSLLT